TRARILQQGTKGEGLCLRPGTRIVGCVLSRAPWRWIMDRRMVAAEFVLVGEMTKPLFHDAPPHAPGELYINHRDGTIRRPNHAPIPLQGPTTGAEYEELKRKEKQNAQAMALLRRQMASTFQCTQ